ncbi:hypothetical protein lerEdw1_004324 [Lerista edwardsae]|nr:hypothetical protein lerEdw1_004324 [Lerista edwardsae]
MQVIEPCPDPEELLLNYLRKGLRLTGTKYGCGIGGCGACTVMISTYNPDTKEIRHYPANSCLLPLCSLYGAAVTTVEGVGSTKTKLNPIQQRLATCHGSQCGFCTPGMVMSMYALLRNRPEPTMEQIMAALDGLDIKILGAYYPVFLYPARIPDLQVASIGDNGILIGAATRLAQLREILLNVVPELPEEKTKIYRVLLKQLKTLAGEQIRNLASLGGHIVSRGSTWDLNSVLAAGKAILNLASIGGVRQIPLNDEFLARLPEADLWPREVIVSVFIPFSKEDEFVSAFRQAERRRNALSVTNSSMQVLFQPGSDVIEDLTILYGGIDCVTVSARQSCQALLGRNWNEEMLDEACRLILGEIIVSPSAPGGKVEYRRTLLVSFFFRFYLEVLQGLKNKLELHATAEKKVLMHLQELHEDEGGGSGGGDVFGALLGLNVVLSPEMQEAIKHNSYFGEEKKIEQGNITEGFKTVDNIIEGEFRAGGQKHFYMETNSVFVIPRKEDKEMDIYVSTQDASRVQVGFMNDGKIKAADLQVYINTGCTPDESDLIIQIAVLKSFNAYEIPNFRCRGRVCKTYLPTNTAFRGFGFANVAISAESWVSAVADFLDLPHDKVREVNMYKTPTLTPYKEEVDPRNLVTCWEECLKKSDYYNRRKAAEEFNNQNYWKKKGIAIIPAAALVHIYLDGSVLVSHGGSELGQGIFTKMLQVASHELKIPMSYIHPYERTTVTIPNSIITAASIGTEVNGKAVQNACQILRKRLEPIIKKNPEGKWEDWVKAAHRESISLSATGFFKGYVVNMDWEKGEGHPMPYYVFGVSCSEVEIDCLTGDHKNIRTDIVMDGCFSINPAIDIGQVEGAFIQGLGLYTMEEIKFSPEGQQYTLGPDTYKIPAVCDVPEQLRTYLLPNTRNPIAIYSSKGLGEVGVFLGSSVFFAVRDAVAAARKERGLNNVFTMDTPLNGEKIRMACADQFTEMIPKDNPGTYKPWAIQVN